MPSIENPEQVEDILIESVKDVPTQFRELFKREIGTLAARVRMKLEVIKAHNPGQNTGMEKLVKDTVDCWLNEAEVMQVYGEYCGMMKAQSKDPFSREVFLHKDNGGYSLFKRFEHIKKAGIKVSSWVRNVANPHEKPRKVISITTVCELIFQGSNGRRKSSYSPAEFMVVDMGGEAEAVQ